MSMTMSSGFERVEVITSVQRRQRWSLIKSPRIFKWRLMQTRRRFTLAFKQQIVEETCQPGASLASVALSHQINANQLHRWRRELLQLPGDGRAERFVPVTLAKPNGAYLTFPCLLT